MQKFDLDRVVDLMRTLLSVSLGIFARDGNKGPMRPEDHKYLQGILRRFLDDCKVSQLPVSVNHIERLQKVYAAPGRYEDAWLELYNLSEAIKDELKTKVFLMVSSEMVSRYENPRYGWEQVIDAFPNSSDDIEEMNKCFALHRYTAAVFHSLMVVEHGLVKLGERFGVTDPKEGWDASCRTLEKIIKNGHAENRTTLEFKFLEQTNTCVQTMKHAWRNKVNHATGRLVVMSSFAPDVAEEIITASRAFMRRLAEGLS
jgi:hypothetical protein